MLNTLFQTQLFSSTFVTHLPLGLYWISFGSMQSHISTYESKCTNVNDHGDEFCHDMMLFSYTIITKRNELGSKTNFFSSNSSK